MSDCRHRSRSRYSKVMGLFRREFATILYYSGVEILDAIRIFGHADAREMLEIYAELRVDESNRVKVSKTEHIIKCKLENKKAANP